MSDYDPIQDVLQALPEKSLTTRLLGALDYLVPGEWENVVNYEAMIKRVTGEDDQALIQKVGEKAIHLYNDPEQGYHRAVQIYHMIDNTSGLAGLAALASKVGQSYESLSFLANVTPKADTTQAIDAGLKFVGELAAFCYCNGLPGDTVSDFAAALASYEKEDSMRFASWLAFDCVLPLGPDFLSKVMELLSSLSNNQLGEHSRFSRLANLLPGGDIAEKKDLILRNLDSSKATISNFVSSKGMEQQGIFDRVKEYVDVADNSLDWVAAAIDLGTNCFEHTGIQSVARRVISRAYGEI
ncbi:MAG: hypothetical protein ABI193_21950 [Minicystis sp.]